MEADNEQSIGVNSSRSLSRRRVLQLLAASGGFAALDRLLPDSWITPVAAAAADSDVTAAALPPGCMSDNFRLRVRSQYVSNLGSVGSTTKWEVQFGYNDSASLLGIDSMITAVVNDNGALHYIYNDYPLGKVGSLTPYTSYRYSVICNDAPVWVTRTVGNGSFSFAYNAATLAYYTQAAAETPTVDWFLTDSTQRDSNLQQTALVPGPTAVDLAQLDVQAVDDGLKTAVVVGAAALGAAAVMAMKNGENGVGSAEESD